MVSVESEAASQKQKVLFNSVSSECVDLAD